MLDYSRDRLDYGELLAPPEGYELDAGILATYSLDPSVLVSIPVALCFGGALRDNPELRPFETLEAIRRTMGKITVFCQAGHIHIPDQFSVLFAWAEDSIVQIRLSEARRSFHPKVCVLRYVKADFPVRYQVIVLSRNLTKDRDWDIAAQLDGEVATRVNDQCTPLVDFLRYLDDYQPGRITTTFLDELARVEFQRIPGFSPNMAFHPIGIPGYARSPIAMQTGDEMLVVSPFLDVTCLSRLRERVSGTRTLVSRTEELARLPTEALQGFSCYGMADFVVDGESILDEESEVKETRAQNLHAKLFIYQLKGQVRWFLGSANATSRAFGTDPTRPTDSNLKNVEFLLELRGSGQGIQLEPILQDMIGRVPSIFEPFVPMDSDELDEQNANATRALEDLEFALTQPGVLSGEILETDESDSFDLNVQADLGDIELGPYTVTLAPFNVDASPVSLESGIQQVHVFRAIALASLSRFVSVIIRQGQETCHRFLLKLDLTGMPDGRADAVLRQIVSDAEQFIRYLAFLLSIDADAGLGEEPQESKGSNGMFFQILGSQKPVFESLLRAASREPELLDAIGDLIERLDGERDGDGNTIIPDSFKTLWVAFEGFTKKGGTTDGN